MPFLIVNETREIFEVHSCPAGRWMNINIECKRLENWHYELEWSYVPAYGIRNMENGDIIVQTRDMAYDVEYYYRGQDEIAYTDGRPGSVQFS
jgi:hypothetical protein